MNAKQGMLIVRKRCWLVEVARQYKDRGNNNEAVFEEPTSGVNGLQSRFARWLKHRSARLQARSLAAVYFTLHYMSMIGSSA